MAGKAKDLTGLKFNHWEVLRRDEASVGKKHPRWVCRCQCGTIKSVIGKTLVAGTSRSCRCCSDHESKGKVSSRMWSRIGRSARLRGLEVDLGHDHSESREYIYGLLASQGFRCALSGLPINLANTVAGDMRGETSASLDRIDSSKGYVTGNVQWVHKDLNKMKWELPQSQFI